MFELIYEDKYRRVAITTPTQFGKSDTTSMALIHRGIDSRIKICIVSPSIKQSEIIMGLVIQHFFDHPDVRGMLNVDYSLEKLKRERSKNRLTLRNDSEIAILTADARTLSQEGKGLMGFGADLVVVDESALIPDEMYGKVLRMVGGTGGKIVQLGNPFPSPHFQNAFTDENYTTLHVDYRQAIAEGRLSREFVEEARRTITAFDFEVFYETKFPRTEGRVFRNISRIMTASPREPIPGHLYVMGVDLAKVQDYTVVTVYDRRDNAQVYQERFNELDWVLVKEKIKAISHKYNRALVCLDSTGLGSPIFDDLTRAGVPVEPYQFTQESKKDLIEKLVLFTEQNNVTLLPDDLTRQELSQFTYSISANGRIRYEAPPGLHDDIVIAHALAVYLLQPIVKLKQEPELPPIAREYDQLKKSLEQKQRGEQWIDTDIEAL